jgi:hypothetical protein
MQPHHHQLLRVTPHPFHSIYSFFFFPIAIPQQSHALRHGLHIHHCLTPLAIITLVESLVSQSLSLSLYGGPLGMEKIQVL